MKIKIISAIYFDLYGTDLGGRPGRNDHYLYSMNSIMNISDAYFTIYTNDKNKLDNFYTTYYPDKLNRFTSVEYDLRNTQYKDRINKIKNIETTKQSDRCIELQYSKLDWLNINNYDCDYIYWIDAGLCYSGLLPNKYLKVGKSYNDSYYGSDLFSNLWLYNLITYTKDRVFICAKENLKNYWDSSLPYKYFITEINSDYHIIGGLFGGCADRVNILYDKFLKLISSLLENENYLYSEEQILSCLFVNYPQLFISEIFDTWWHEDNIKGHLDSDSAKIFIQNNKSFYKILEKFID